MYHTFQASTATGSPTEAESGKTGKSSGSRRISTSNACVECRRRKIRCDGAQPCSQCQWYQHPDLCMYSKPTQRVVPSRKLVDKLQSQVDQCHSIFARLFPGQELEQLMGLPREELINLAVTLPAPNASPLTDSATSPQHVPDITSRGSDGADSLDALEQAPDQDPVMDEEKRHKNRLQVISDDVNGLSLSVNKQSSYVGVSSFSAVLKVIFRCAPVARKLVAQYHTETALPSRSNSPPPQIRATNPDYLPPPDVGHRLIESYFANVHGLMPMVDEDQFWHTYLYGERNDSPWLALLNMVMALGSLASSTCDNEEHVNYYQRARKHLDLETFGSGNLLVLQALGLLSGYYLHWLSRPNEANSLMGATMRMATALGLHREYNDRRPGPNQQAIQVSTEVPADIRRRTWWTLFLLDTWANMTTGRPSLGRMGIGITVQSPRIGERLNNAQYLASLRLLPLIHNITFAKIATRIQDTLAACSLPKFDELFALDSELEKWHDELPPILRDFTDTPVANKSQIGSKRRSSRAKITTPSAASANRKNPFDFSQPPERDGACPEVLKTPRSIMHWWYLITRMLLHRPFLLSAAMRRTPFSKMSAEEKLAVSRCRIVAGQAIMDISSGEKVNLIPGWCGTWLMHQAVTVPLVSLFSYLSSPVAYSRSSTSPGKTGESNVHAMTGGDEDADIWREQIEIAIDFFGRMRCYCHAALKTREMVESLYEASKQVNHMNAELYQQQLQQHQQQQKTIDHQPNSKAKVNRSMPKSEPDAYPMPPISTAYQPQHPSQVPMYPPVFNTSPNGDAAMNSFWEDMVWDNLSEMPETAAWMPGIDQYDWLGNTGQQLNFNAGGHDWSLWPADGQAR